MPSSPWVSLQVQTPDALTAVNTAVTGALSSVKTQLQLVQAEVRAKALLMTSPDDLTLAGLNAAVQAVMHAAETAVSQLLDDTGAYMLVVPLPKKGFVRLLPNSASNAPGSTFFSLPLPNLIEQLPEEERVRLRDSSIYEQLSDASSTYNGGNAYFVRTVAESMFDPRDSSRPKFSNQDYWAYAVLIGGAADVASAVPLATFVERLVGNLVPGSATRGISAVVPQNVRVTQSGRGRLAVVEWEPVSPSRVLISFDDAVVRPVEYVIVKSKDFRVMTAQTVADLFGTEDLELNQTGRFGAKVIAKNQYDGITARWIDHGSLEVDTDYYYMVGFKCRVIGPETPWRADPDDHSPIFLPYDKLVATGPIRVRTGAAPLTHGRLPDWTRVPSFATFVPPVEKFLDSCLEVVRSIGRATQTASDINDRYVAALEAEVQRYATMIEEFSRRLQTITNLLTMPRSAAGVGMKTGTGQGSAATFLSQVIKDFSDLSDTNRPAFDQGDEYVTGLVLLAVGPDPDAVLKQLEIFKLLFGGGDENELLSGVNSIGDQIAILEREVIEAEAEAAFNDDMSPRPVGSGDAACDPVVPEAGPTFGPSMRPEEV